MPHRLARTSPSGTPVSRLFFMEVENSAAVRPNRRGRLPSPGTARTPRDPRRRPDLVDANSPNRPNDGSRARSPRNGGGGKRPRVADHPDEDGPNK